MPGVSLCSSEWYVPADIVADGKIDIVDFAKLASDWLMSDCGLCGNADLTFDGSVTLDDLKLFSQRWLDINYKNEFCTKNVLVVSQPELTTDLIAGSDNRILCSENASYVFATDPNGDVYRRQKTAGSQWALVATGVANAVWCLWDNQHLFGTFGIYQNTTFRYSEDNGETWHNCITPPAPSKYAIFYPGWSLGFRKPGQGGDPNNPLGTVILAEYGPTGRKINKSVDFGKNWAKQYEVNAITEIVDWNALSHFHTVAYHAATDRFLAILGDGPNARMYYSTDDGNTWIVAQINSGVQPVQLLDFGHPTEFVCGADRSLGVYTLDVSNMETAVKHQKLKNWDDRTGAQRYCFMLRYFNGLYYAFQMDTDSPDRLNKISVSPDLENWAVYYQFSNNERGVRYVGGQSEDGIHVSVIDNLGKYRSMILKPARTEIRDSIKIIPPINNVFATSNIYLGDQPNSVSYWTQSDVNSAIIASDPNGGLFAERHVKMSKGNAGFLSAYNPFSMNYVPRDGRTYVGRIWFRGYSSDQIARFQVGTSIKGFPYYGGYITLINKDDWLEVITDPITVPATGGLAPMSLRMYIGDKYTNKISGNAEIHVGGICISPNRVGLQLDGNSEYPQMLRRLVGVPESWSSYFRIVPDVRYSSMTQYDIWDVNTLYAAGVWATYNNTTYESLSANNAGHNPQQATDFWRCVPNFRWHVKTWMQDTKNYLCLYLDSIDQKFKLDAVVDGNIVETLQTATPVRFEWMSQLDIAVCLSGAEGQESLKLSVSNAGHLEHVVANSIELKSAIANGYMRGRQLSQVIGNQSWQSTKTVGGVSRDDMMTMPLFVVPENAQEFGAFLSNSELESDFNGL
jgi:hypothetical protein